VCENKVPMKISRSKKYEVIEQFRLLYKEEFRDLYRSPSVLRTMKSRRLRWVDHVARLERPRNVCRMLVGKPRGHSPLGRQRKWEDNKAILRTEA
jgi:hypothetical protein